MFRFRFLFAAVVMAATAFPMSASLAANRNVEIINRTGVTMSGFYASRVSTSDWEENIIKGQPLRSGKSVVIDIDDGTGACRFDFKAVFTDGDEVISEDNNVCKLEKFTFE